MTTIQVHMTKPAPYTGIRDNLQSPLHYAAFDINNVTFIVDTTEGAAAMRDHLRRIANDLHTALAAAQNAVSMELAIS